MMKLAIAAIAIVVGLGLMPQDAEAKRLGGGKSFGMQRQATPAPAAPAAAPTQAAKPAAPAAAPAATATPPKQGMSRFLGPLAGLAAGLGIAALLSHFGLGEAAANFLLIALLVVAAIFVLRLLMRKREPQPAMQYAGAGPASFTPAQFEATPTVGAGDTAIAPATGNIPADFDVAGFVRQAKLNFIRLQAANDRGDMEDIRQFTAPELFAEIKMQHQERGAKAQETDVQQLDAEVLEVVTDGGNHVASVRFRGQIREDNAAPEAFAEIWHLAKPVDGSRGWTIAGIQQVQ
ncbi:MAG: Tim44 domain-containing protein [Rhodocyclales bacterium]|nr:Tim44 domain-containing protein [Rhodocyclales bacterium]